MCSVLRKDTESVWKLWQKTCPNMILYRHDFSATVQQIFMKFWTRLELSRWQVVTKPESWILICIPRYPRKNVIGRSLETKFCLTFLQKFNESRSYTLKFNIIAINLRIKWCMMSKHFCATLYVKEYKIYLSVSRPFLNLFLVIICKHIKRPDWVGAPETRLSPS